MGRQIGLNCQCAMIINDYKISVGSLQSQICCSDLSQLKYILNLYLDQTNPCVTVFTVVTKALEIGYLKQFPTANNVKIEN